MLEQKLAEANQAAKRKRIIVILLLAGATTFVGLFFAGYIRFDVGMPGPKSETAVAPDDRQVTKTNPTAGAASAITSEPPRPPVPTTPATTGQTVENPADRETVKDALAVFDQTFKPLAESDGFRAWSPKASTDILAARDAAVDAFGAGAYDKALENLRAGGDLGQEKLEAYNAAFDAAYDKAIVAYQNDEPEAALLNITEALRIKPESQDALELKGRIDQLPDVLDLIKQAVTARIENDPEREADLLRQIVTLDDSRIEQRERLDTVLSEIRENRYARAISSGMAAVEKRDLATAEKNLESAAQLFSTRDAVKLLSSQVATLRQELRAETLIRQGVDASAADDWAAAQQHFAGARTILPNNKDATDGLQLATKIVSLKAEIAKHLAAPARLANPSVEERVDQLLRDANAYKQFSPSLQAVGEGLSAVVQAYSTPVPVSVISDGETHVSVRGVGQVGQTTGRTINLKPGTYMFEGKRKGYVSVLVKVELKPGAEGVSVEVICNEPV